MKQEDKECPAPECDSNAPKRGRQARSKSRNLLERLRNYEEDVLRFIDIEVVPFTKNQGERDIRMTKVQQKVSGCFRSMEGAEIFCAVRSYLSTCRKHQVGIGEALACLFSGTWPDFIQEKLDIIGAGSDGAIHIDMVKTKFFRADYLILAHIKFCKHIDLSIQ